MNISNYWDHLIIRTISGSRAYGMATAQSDLDIKGIFIPPKPFLLGIHNIEQHQWKYYDEISTLEELNDVMRGIPFDWSANGVEYTYHALRKYVKLAVQCNPNVLEILFAEPTDMIWNGIAPENRKLGELLLGNRHLFLSQRARHSYSGYAVDQLKRIKGHKKFIMSPEPKRAPRHSEFMKFYPMASNGSRIILTPGEDGGSSNPTKHMLSVCGGKPIPGTDNKAFWIYLRGKGLVDKDGALLADYEYNYDPSSPIIGVLVFQKDEYRTRHKKWKEYWDWKKNRNEDRAKMESDFGFDGKHSCHLVRLMRTGYELMTTGELKVFRPDAKELLAIRNGAWSYEKIVGYAEEMDAKIGEVYDTDKCSLPMKPPEAKINDLLQEMIEMKLRRG